MRRFLLVLCIVVFLLGGCSSSEQEENIVNDSQFDEKYLNLSAMDISKEDQLVELFEKQSKTAKTRKENVIIVGKNNILKDTVEAEKKTYGSYQKMYQGIMDAAAEVDVDNYFAKLRESNQKFLKQWEENSSSVDSYQAYSDLFMLSDESYLVSIPDDSPYNVFAYLPFGGFNGCPGNAQLLAVFKYWYEEYGIVPAAITYDSVQITFTKTLSKQEVNLLAEEILLLNIEVQSMEYPTKEDLVKGLKHSSYWLFWWN